MKFLAILVLALATACAYETPVPFREVPFDAESEGRIIGGKEATNGQIPWQVGLSINGLSWCGASLIHEEWVLTAAHCIDSLITGTLYFGDVARTSGTKVSIKKSNVIRHEGYNSNTIANDIALIHLDSPVKTSTVIKTIKLPARSGTYSTYAGDVAQISGWGKTSDSSNVASKLMTAEVSVITNALCTLSYGGSVYGGVICAGTKEGKSTCNGDSGGPMVINNEQVGVVSYGSSAGCTQGYPVAFTRTTFFLDWIQQKSGI